MGVSSKFKKAKEEEIIKIKNANKLYRWWHTGVLLENATIFLGGCVGAFLSSALLAHSINEISKLPISEITDNPLLINKPFKIPPEQTTKVITKNKTVNKATKVAEKVIGKKLMLPMLLDLLMPQEMAKHIFLANYPMVPRLFKKVTAWYYLKEQMVKFLAGLKRVI